MNNLTLDIAKCNTVQKTSYVTTKELAEVLNVDVRTIERTVNKLIDTTAENFSTVLSKSSGGRPSKIFTEEQATLIKQEIQKHHNLASRKIDSVSTDYEMELLTQRVIAYHIQKANEYKERAEKAENRVQELVPKAEVYERISESTGLKTIGETVKILGIGEKRLFALLRENGIFFYDNGVNQVKQQYINSGYFQTKENPYVHNGVNKLYTRIFVTSKGLLWLENKISA